jgi:hypothetical protein
MRELRLPDPLTVLIKPYRGSRKNGYFHLCQQGMEFLITHIPDVRFDRPAYGLPFDLD